jgi:hypothetical protein
VLSPFWDPYILIIIILLYSIFITNFESLETDLPKEHYANCKLCTFQNLNLESILLADLPSSVSLKFRPL